MLNLRGINYGCAIGASGIEGFFSGKEYKYRKTWSYTLMSYVLSLIYGKQNMTFCGKTFTANRTIGNAVLEDDGVTMKDFLPDCIHPYILDGIALNAVGLSNIGVDELIYKNIWQKMEKPFMLSFMAVGKTRDERYKEIMYFVERLRSQISKFEAPVALQINFSCPNVGHDQTELLKEIIPFLDIASSLNIPLIPKVSLLLSPSIVSEISKDKNCDAICITNTIPFGEMPDKIDWNKVFGSDKKTDSPLAKYGGGGLSGKILFPLLCEWLKESEKHDIQKPIIAGGGIMSSRDVRTLSRFKNVKAISPGSVIFLRPLSLPGIIKTANNIFSQK